MKKEISTASARVQEVKEELGNARKEFLKHTSEATLPSIVFHTRKYMRDLVSEIKDRHRRKLESLSSEQEKPLHNVRNTVEIVGGIKVPDLVLDYLSLVPKHTVCDNFSDLHFLADVDRLLYNLKTNDIENDKLYEVNALTEMKQQKEDPNLRKVKSYLRKENIKAVPVRQRSWFLPDVRR